MLLVLLALLIGTLSGTLVGGLLVLQLLSRNPAEAVPVEPAVSVGPAVDAQIRRTAVQWAKTHQRPGSESLVADKLRLVYVLNRRRRQKRRWTR